MRCSVRGGRGAGGAAVAGGLGVGGRVRACVSCSAVQAPPTAVRGDCAPDLLLWARASPGALGADCAEREVSPPPAPRLPQATLVGDGTFAIWKSCCFLGQGGSSAPSVNWAPSRPSSSAVIRVCRASPVSQEQCRAPDPGSY